jgi:hypothetical protein
MRYAMILAVAAFAAVGSAHAAGTNGKWCLNETSAGPGANCSFQTLAQCNASKTANADSCARNSHHSTTGSGASMKSDMKK